MKLLIRYSFFTFLLAQMVLMNACLKNDDLVTKEAKEGGLVKVLSSTVPYKVGTSPTIEISFNVPVGPGVKSVEVMNTFTTVDGSSSNTVLLKTIDVNSENVDGIVESSFSIQYADLVKGILLDGDALPENETDLNIGDTWTFQYVSVMVDGRRVVNNGTTAVGIANPYAGKYSRTGVLVHPTAGTLPYEETGLDLVTVDATTVKTIVGYWENSAYILTITVNSDNTVTIGGVVGENSVTATPGEVNEYDPSSKTFTLNYTYNSRYFSETLTSED